MSAAVLPWIRDCPWRQPDRRAPRSQNSHPFVCGQSHVIYCRPSRQREVGRPRLRVSYSAASWKRWRVLPSRGTGRAQLCGCAGYATHRALGLGAEQLFSLGQQSFARRLKSKIKPMGKNHTTEARCPQTPRLQLPG